MNAITKGHMVIKIYFYNYFNCKNYSILLNFAPKIY